MLNLKELSGRKASNNVPPASGSSRYNPTQIQSSSQRARPVELDTTEFQTQFKFSDNLKEGDFVVLRGIIAKRKE